MKLSDIMSYADLSNYAEIALVLFLGVFVAITIRTFLPSRSRELHEASLLSPRPRAAAAPAGGVAPANSAKGDRRVAGVEAFDMNALVGPPGGVIAPGAPSSMAAVMRCCVCVLPKLPAAA